MKLFLVHYGFYPQGEIWEQHGVVHVAAPSAAEAKKAFKAIDWVKAKKAHVDGIVEVRVDGYGIELIPGTSPQAEPERLGFSV